MIASVWTPESLAMVVCAVVAVVGAIDVIGVRMIDRGKKDARDDGYDERIETLSRKLDRNGGTTNEAGDVLERLERGQAEIRDLVNRFIGRYEVSHKRLQRRIRSLEQGKTIDNIGDDED